MPFCDKSNSRFKLLSLFVEAGESVVSSSALTDKLGMSRQSVFKLVGALRDEGLEIESIPQKGYILRNPFDTDALSPTLIDYLLRDDPIFTKCIYIAEVGSTQHILKKLALADAPEGVLATADQQTQGRGRRGRPWFSPRGKNLYFSILLRPKLAPGDVQLLNLAAGVAVCQAVKECHGVSAELKWPNDVLANGKKICGILSEAAGEPDRVYYAITGIGVNANLTREDMSDDIAAVATSVFMETGKFTPRALLLAQIFTRISALVETLSAEGGKAKLLAIYRQHCATLGSKVRVADDDKEYIGTAEDITEQGAIIINIDGQRKVFAAADIFHLRTL